MTVAPRAAARLSVPTATGSCALSARARSTWRTVAQALPGERPAFSNPWSRIDPILPSPSTATGSSVITASSQAFLEQGRRVGFLVAVLDDHRSVERETPAGGRRTGYGPRAGHDDRPGGNLERSRAGPSIRLLPHHVVHGRRAGEDRARSEHGSPAAAAISTSSPIRNPSRIPRFTHVLTHHAPVAVRSAARISPLARAVRNSANSVRSASP